MATRKSAPALNTGTGSRGYVQRVQELRASGAAGKHLPKSDRRARTRSAARRRAVHRDKAAG